MKDTILNAEIVIKSKIKELEKSLKELLKMRKEMKK